MKKSPIVLILQNHINEYCGHFLYYTSLLKLLKQCYGDELGEVEKKIKQGLQHKGKQGFSEFIYAIFKQDTITNNKSNKMYIVNAKEIILNDVKFIEIMERYFKCKLAVDNINPDGTLFTFKVL